MSSYLIFLAFYYFLGMTGFYFLAKRIFRNTPMAFAAYLLLMFSSLGTRLFDSFIIGIFVPGAWFFYFLTAFTEKPGKRFMLGITFTLMIIVTTYVPFYFVTIFLIFLMCFGVIYFRDLKTIFLKYSCFFKTNKIFSCLCISALLLSLVPGFLFYQESARGEYVLPIRHAGSSIENPLGVRIQTMGGGGIVPLAVKESLTLKTGQGLFSNLRQYQLGTFYIPVFAYLLLLFGGMTSINKRLVLLAAWGFGIYLISLNDATPLYHFLYDHIFYFKYFRNFEFFLWVVLLPIGILFLVEQFQMILNYQPRSRKERYVSLAYVSILHLGFTIFIYKQGDDLISSYLVVGLSLLLFFFHFAQTPRWGVSTVFFLPCLLILIAAQPLEVYQYLGKNAQKGGGPYRYSTEEHIIFKDFEGKSHGWLNGLFVDLNTNGYIERMGEYAGVIQNKFRRLKNESEMVLGERYADKRAEIYKVLQHAPTMDYVRFLLPELANEDDLPDPAFKKAPGNMYFGTKWFYFLRKNLNSNILKRYLERKILVYDRVEWIDDTPFTLDAPVQDPFREGEPSKYEEIKRVEEAFARNQNTAFINRHNGLQGKTRGDIPEKTQVMTRYYPFIRLLDFDINFIKLKTNFNSQKFLVYNDNFYTGWQAFINGKKVDLYRANIAFKGLWVPPGENIVTLRFGSPWQYAFKFLLLGIFYSFCVYFFILWVREYRVNKNLKEDQKYNLEDGGRLDQQQIEPLMEKSPLFSLFKFLKWAFSRGLVLYFIMYLLSQGTINKEKFETGIMVRTLNRLIPSVSYLVNIGENREEPDRIKLEKYIEYYKKVIHFNPLMADAQGLLGFCYYHSGEYKKAVTSYKKAIEINPHFFWFYYNLGVIHFKNGHYVKAVESLQKAAKTKLRITLAFIRMSKNIYKPIIKENFILNGPSSIEQLTVGYRDGYILQILSRYSLKNYEEVLRLSKVALESHFSYKEFFYYYAGRSAFELKNFSEAINFFELAIQVDPNYADANHYLDLVSRAGGKQKAAMTVREKAIILPKTKAPNIFIEDQIDLKIY